VPALGRSSIGLFVVGTGLAVSLAVPRGFVRPERRPMHAPSEQAEAIERLRTARHYAVVISKGASTYRAVVPDLPGCAAVCRTRAEVEQVIRLAIAGHIRGLRRQGLAVPEPTSDIVIVGAE